MKSERIDFEKLNNTRDLGGLITKSGKKIRKGRLFRSGILHKASESDVGKLKSLTELIIDFRSSKELIERPDPSIESVTYAHLPIIRELTEGITREKEASVSVTKKYAESPEGARQYMINIYKNFVIDEFPLSNYSKFIDLLLEDREKAILWHCTAGKDRAGFGAVIIEEILGVDRDSIFEDYLYTNECLKDEIKIITLNLMYKNNIDSQDINKTLLFQKSIDCIFGAKEEYLLGLYEKIQEVYKDFNGFLKDGLKISEAKQERLRELYLE